MSNSNTSLAKNSTYELDWYRPGKILHLKLSGNYQEKDAAMVNKVIETELAKAREPLFLLIDAMQLQRPHNFKSVRSAQTFMDHKSLKHIYVAAGDRLVKLAMMVIFNLSRAPLTISDSPDKATYLLERQISR